MYVSYMSTKQDIDEIGNGCKKPFITFALKSGKLSILIYVSIYILLL